MDKQQQSGLQRAHLDRLNCQKKSSIKVKSLRHGKELDCVILRCILILCDKQIEGELPCQNITYQQNTTYQQKQAQTEYLCKYHI